MYSFSYLEPVCCSMSSLTVAPDLHTGFSRGRSGGLVFPSLSEFSTVDCDPTVKGFGIVNKAEIDVFKANYGRNNEGLIQDDCNENREGDGFAF